VLKKSGKPYNNLKGKKFGRLEALYPLDERSKDGKVIWMCRCDCGNTIPVTGVYLTTGETKSCGCLKKDLVEENLRNKYNEKRVDGVVMPLFKGEKPRKDSSTGFRGVSKYYTRKSKELRYRAWITVAGKKYYKAGFKTAEDAYNGRLALEKEHLPTLEKTEEKENESN
jgi:hypothetical protein